MAKYDVITIFPDYLKPLEISLIGKAQQSGRIQIAITDLREFAAGVHKSVDDTPYGGGAGMVMSPEPWGKAIDAVAERVNARHELVILTPAGKKFNQDIANEFSRAEHLILACGRYEGIDQRVTEHYQGQENFKVHEISIGDYVLNGGEVAALVILESVIRLLPGVLGNPASLDEESHSIKIDFNNMVEYPNYTKPQEWRGLSVPEVLLSGDHAAVANWRSKAAIDRTKKLK